jgi:RNA polymerase sigma-70 factor (ECF subfamily)
MSFEHEDLVAIIPRLRAYARSLAHNRVLADDLVQDALLNALQAREQFRPGTNLRAWVFTILRHRFLSHMTRGPRSVDVRAEDRDVSSGGWTPATQESGIEVAAFKQVFRSLSPRHREVLVLVGVHGMRYEEVAQICRCEVGTVKSRVCRAREQLRAQLLEEEAGPPGGAAKADGLRQLSRASRGRAARNHREGPVLTP